MTLVASRGSSAFSMLRCCSTAGNERRKRSTTHIPVSPRCLLTRPHEAAWTARSLSSPANFTRREWRVLFCLWWARSRFPSVFCHKPPRDPFTGNSDHNRCRTSGKTNIKTYVGPARLRARGNWPARSVSEHCWQIRFANGASRIPSQPLMTQTEPGDSFWLINAA